NLDMDPAVVSEVSGRGEQAAELLLSHFVHPSPDVTLTWDNHRWIRFRSAFARFEELLTQVEQGLSEPETGEVSYEQLLNRGPEEPPSSYRVSEHQRSLIELLMKQLEQASDTIQAAPEENHPTHKQPRPTPELRVLPRTVPDAQADKPDAV